MSEVSIIIDCYNSLHSQLNVTADACLSARSAVRAAEIQAKAARSAGTQSLLSGMMALLAGGLAYFAARSETNRLSKIEKSKSISYTLRIKSILMDCKKELIDIDNLESKTIIYLESNMPEIMVLPNFSTVYFTNLDIIRELISPNRWEELSNLPEDKIVLYVEIGKIINDIINKWATNRNEIQIYHNSFMSNPNRFLDETKKRYSLISKNIKNDKLLITQLNQKIDLFLSL